MNEIEKNFGENTKYVEIETLINRFQFTRDEIDKITYQTPTIVITLKNGIKYILFEHTISYIEYHPKMD